MPFWVCQHLFQTDFKPVFHNWCLETKTVRFAFPDCPAYLVKLVVLVNGGYYMTRENYRQGRLVKFDTNLPVWVWKRLAIARFVPAKPYST